MATTTQLPVASTSDHGDRLCAKAIPALVACLGIALLAACGGGGGGTADPAASADRKTALSQRASVKTAAASATTLATSNPAAVQITGIVGYGTNLANCGQVPAFGANSYPINNAGVVAINSVLAWAQAPCPSPSFIGFYLTKEGVSYDAVPTFGPNDFQGDFTLGYAINDVNTLTYQGGGLGNPPQFTYFSLPVPYTAATSFSAACACYTRDLHTNESGQGVALRYPSSGAAGTTLRVDRFDGLGGSQTLTIDPTYLGSENGVMKTRILRDGTIFVGVQVSSTLEIWRFAPGETTNHTVVYSKPRATATNVLSAWDVNEAERLVVAEYVLNQSGGAALYSVMKIINADATESVIEGTQTASSTIFYETVFINQAGMVAASRFTSSPTVAHDLLYAPPGGSAVRVFGTGDSLGGQIVQNRLC